MANRTNPGLVAGVLAGGRDYYRNADLGPYCDAANTIVNRLVQNAAAKGLALNADELLKIETWLGAWAYKQSDQQHSNDSDLGASANYQGQSGMYFSDNKYGQMAMMLDPTGILRAMNDGVALEAAWLGKTRQEQVPYDQRGN